MVKETLGEKTFDIFNMAFLIFLAFLCVLPLWNVLCISFSDSSAVEAGWVKLWPIKPTLASYEFVFTKPAYFQAFWVSIQRTLLGVGITMLISVITAYPLSKEPRDLPCRDGIVWFFFITMLFSGGLIPTYAVITSLHLMNKIWVLVIPGALNVWNVILLLNFMRGLPKEVTESAYVDGAKEWNVLWQIVVPMSKPVLATVTLFSAIGQWNAWFDGLIYMNEPSKYPLQTYLRSLVIQIDTTKLSSMTEDEIKMYTVISNRTFNAAQIFVAIVPILLVYPFLQKYFVKGIVLGSVKE